MSYVIGLRCTWVRVILAYISGMKSQNVIGWKIVGRCGSGTFSGSAKLQRNIPRKSMPRWYMGSNQIVYFYNTPQIIWETRLQQLKIWFGKAFCLIFSSENQNLSPPSEELQVWCRSRNPAWASWISWRLQKRDTHFSMCKHIVDSSHYGGRIVFQHRSPSGTQGRTMW